MGTSGVYVILTNERAVRGNRVKWDDAHVGQSENVGVRLGAPAAPTP